MFENLYLWAGMGVLAVILLKVQSLNSATPKGTTYMQNFLDWLSISWIYMLLGLVGLVAVMNFSFLGMVPPVTPADAFVRGLSVFAIAEAIRQLAKPILVETTSTNSLKVKGDE